MQPPLPPFERSFRRVLAISQVDGWCLVVVAALGVLGSLLQGGYLVTTAGLLVILAGTGELHGRRLLLRHDARGLGWLVGAQLFLLAVIWTYAWARWRYFNAAALWAELPRLAQEEITRQLLVAGLDPALDRPLLLQMMNLMVCVLLVFLTLLYQGGLALYYTLQHRHVRQALLAPPLLPQT